MRNLMLAVIALTLVSTSATAMSVAEFLAKARALQARGIFSAFSPDIAPLRAEMVGIARAYRADLNAARAAGRRPHSCPPAKAPKVTADQFLAELEKIPRARRNMSMKTAFYAIMARRFPCR